MSLGKIFALILLGPAVVFAYAVLAGYEPRGEQALTAIVMFAIGGVAFAVDES